MESSSSAETTPTTKFEEMVASVKNRVIKGEEIPFMEFIIAFPPKPSCSKCYGRGKIGQNLTHKEGQWCPCVLKQARPLVEERQRRHMSVLKTRVEIQKMQAEQELARREKLALQTPEMPPARLPDSEKTS